MKVQEMMSTRVETCRVGDSLERAAQVMWDADCGVIPIVDDESSRRRHDHRPRRVHGSGAWCRSAIDPLDRGHWVRPQRAQRR